MPYSVHLHSPDAPEMELFRQVATDLYTDDPRWTAPDDPPALPGTICALVRCGENVVGRACGMVNMEIAYNGAKTALIGWYECSDDPAAAGLLLRSIASHFRDQGYSYLIGPMNGSTWHRYRFADPSEAPPFFLDVHTKPWYVEQFTDHGFETIARYSSTRFDPGTGDPERVGRSEELYRSQGITIRPIRTDDFENELRRLHQITLESFTRNFLYTPIPFESFRAMYTPIAPLIQPSLVQIAESADGRPLGYIFTIGDRFNRTTPTLIIKTAGIVPMSRTRGLGTLLIEKMHIVAREQGYQACIHALMHQNNPSASILSNESRPYRTYRLLGRSL